MIDLLIGCVAGIFIGATGVGAGSILTPLLILRGHDPLTAVMTGLVAVIAARTVGSVQHVLSGHWPATHGSHVLIAGVVGAGLSFVVVRHFVALTEGMLQMTLGILLLCVGLAGFVPIRVRTSHPALMTLAAAGTGAAVATTSAGSGTLLGAFVFPITRWHVHEFSAVNSVFGLLCGLIGIAAYSQLGRFDPRLLGYVTTGAVAGIVMGVFASRHIRREPFAWALRVVTIVLGAGLLIR